MPVSVSRPSRLLTALALWYKTSVRLLTEALAPPPRRSSPPELTPAKMQSLVISVCCYLASGEYATHIIRLSNSIPLAQIAVSLF